MCPTPQNSSSQEIPPGEARILVVVVVRVVLVLVVGGRCNKMETVRWRPGRAPFGSGRVPGAKRWKRCAGAQGAHHFDLEGKGGCAFRWGWRWAQMSMPEGCTTTSTLVGMVAGQA